MLALLVLAVVSIASSKEPAVDEAPDTEYLDTQWKTLCLLKLKWSKLLTNWNCSGIKRRNPCKWEGLACKGPYVTSLAMSNFYGKLQSTFPSELGLLTKLRLITLENNSLKGTLPPELGKLVELRGLFLKGNGFNSSIPVELGNLVLLQDLWLNNNRFEGAIPSQLSNLVSLKKLYLNQNNFSGTLPPELGSMSALQFLYVNHNQLTGTIPSEWGNLTSIVGLHLNNNDLTGFIPTELGNLKLLSYLYLNNNSLKGRCWPFGSKLIQGNLTNIAWDCECDAPAKWQPDPCYVPTDYRGAVAVILTLVLSSIFYWYRRSTKPKEVPKKTNKPKPKL